MAFALCRLKNLAQASRDGFSFARLHLPHAD
jgi:hypothetical protein